MHISPYYNMNNMYIFIFATVLATFLISLLKDRVILGVEVFLFGYPLIIMDITRNESTDIIHNKNELRHARKFPTASWKAVIRPNVDTLYSTAMVSVDEGPWIFEMPINTDRYELVTFLDGWTNVFASPGTRTLNHSETFFFLTNSSWDGDVPLGMTQLVCQTNMAWLIGRLQADGEDDFETVHYLQDRLKLYKHFEMSARAEFVPMAVSSAGKQDISTKRPFANVILNNLSTLQYFNRLMQLMVDNPPYQEDGPLVERMARVGLEPGKQVALSALNLVCFQFGRWLASAITSFSVNQRPSDSSWRLPPLNLGRYGTDYGTRAAVAQVGLGANLAEDTIYSSTAWDHEGKDLIGSNAYYLHFNVGQLPPVKAFWSITAYDIDGFFIDNPLKRFALRDRDPLTYNSDGSLDIWIQAVPPTNLTLQSNWLPVKENEKFSLTARLYWPHESIASGLWTVPKVIRID